MVCVCENVKKMNFEFDKMLVKERNDLPIRPVLLKFGVALVISIGGIVFTLFRTRIFQPQPKSKPSQPSPGNGRWVDSRLVRGDLRDVGRVLQDSYLQNVPSNISICDRSSNSRRSGERDDFLLPEFNELVKECNMSMETYEFSPKKTGESLLPGIESLKDSKCTDHEQEINRLLARVKTLEEREKKLESQLLEYYGVKEHENAVMELKKQLRLTNVEAKLYNLKIESLVSNNKKLEARFDDYTNVVMELETTRGNMKMLKKKLKLEGEQNREQILALQERVMRLKDEEKKAAEISQELEMVMMERNELKEELEKMRETNQSLKLEKSDLTQKLDYVQMLATTALDNEEVLELREERRRLRKENERLKKEIDRHQADRSKDVEELVYLRWTNAFLRQQMQNSQSDPSNNATLVRPPSPGLDDKLKTHFALDHTHNNNNNNNKASPVGNTPDFDIDSQASCLTDISERDDSAIDASSINSKTGSIHSSKPKVFAKLRKLLRGKGGNSRNSSAQGLNGQKPPLERAVSVEDFASKISSDFHFYNSRDSTDGSLASRRSFDIQRSYSRGQKSAAWESSNCSSRTMDSLVEDDQDWSPDAQPPLLEKDDDEDDDDDNDGHNQTKTELLKYAESLKNCHSKKFPKRTALFA